ncbi:hypothetical protein BJ165DRAFT_1517538 [Panaeolus papilionaceus]|nr:hypothetical protein BJ165DRAFT_1517538 [Panaeolus papilionaceus]
MPLLSNNEPDKRPDPATIAPLDWKTTPLSNAYLPSHYLKIIDSVFSDEECQALKALAESDAQWAQAAVHYGLGENENYVNTDYRNSDRILRFDFKAAEELYERLRPYVEEIAEIRAGDKYEKLMVRKIPYNGVYKMIGVNERLSYLRYGPGHYFKGHCDFLHDLPDGRVGQVTIQIYLGEDGVEGGATRIAGGSPGKYVDVFPKKGRVLIFQHKDVFHSGEEVTSGLKFTLRSDLLYRYFEE